MAQNQEGEQLISDMESLLGVPVFAYSDIQGAQISEAGSTETGRLLIMTLCTVAAHFTLGFSQD